MKIRSCLLVGVLLSLGVGCGDAGGSAEEPQAAGASGKAGAGGKAASAGSGAGGDEASAGNESGGSGQGGSGAAGAGGAAAGASGAEAGSGGSVAAGGSDGGQGGASSGGSGQGTGGGGAAGANAGSGGSEASAGAAGTGASGTGGAGGTGGVTEGVPVILIGEITGTVGDEVAMIQEGVALANKTMALPCFKEFILAASWTETEGLSQAEIYEKLASGPVQVNIDMFMGSWVQNHVYKTIGYEDEPGTVHMNRYFVDTAYMVASNVIHEAEGHSQGFSHYGVKATSVPYGLNDAFEACSPVDP